MTTDQTPDRIPLAHSVHYAVRGLPEVPNKHGAGVLAPCEITLTYRAAPDSQLGRVHAYVAGRLWIDGAEIPTLSGGLYGQHYDDGLDDWPEWLAEEARLHDPERAAVSQADVLREAADALDNSETLRDHTDDHMGDVYAATAELRRMADEAQPGGGEGAESATVLSPAERTMLAYALDQAQEHIWSRDGFTNDDQAAVTPLRRLTATPQQDGARS
ncbi:hypothetical protein SUDANB1_00430 [Streptomyces sp. enrichment culture]|uniref:hypothetical protein n=1 Tax=Streptomyces sp. enrichment culture TaxID=1795815 RepID=UPI003F56C243